jgi:hypothetical protein
MGIEATIEHGLRNPVGHRHHVLVAFGRANGGDNSLPYAGDDRFFCGPSDKLCQVSAHSHPGTDAEFDPVLGDSAKSCLGGGRIGAIDNLGIDAGLDGVEHIAAGEVDGGGTVEVEVDIGAVGRNDSTNDSRHISPGQVVGFEPSGCNSRRRVGPHTRLHGGDLGLDDRLRIYLAEAHPDEAQGIERNIRDKGLEPESQVVPKHHQHHQPKQQQEDADDHHERPRPKRVAIPGQLLGLLGDNPGKVGQANEKGGRNVHG